jgi:hypothetical protein
VRDDRHDLAALVEQAIDPRQGRGELVLLAADGGGGGKGLLLGTMLQQGDEPSDRHRHGAAHGHDKHEGRRLLLAPDARQIREMHRDEQQQQEPFRPDRRQAGDDHHGRIGRVGADARSQVQIEDETGRGGAQPEQ